MYVCMHVCIVLYCMYAWATFDSSQGGQEKKSKKKNINIYIYLYFLDVAYASNNTLHCNALCQYSAVKNPLMGVSITLSANSPSCWQRQKKTIVIHQFSGVDGRAHAFDAVEPSSRLPFAELFLPFQISYRIRKAFIFNKMKEIIKKLKIKYRVGLG